MGPALGSGQQDFFVGAHASSPFLWNRSSREMVSRCSPRGTIRVHKAVLQEELGLLEALGQLLADGLLDDPGPGKADGGPGLRHDDVPVHGEGWR